MFPHIKFVNYGRKVKSEDIEKSLVKFQKEATVKNLETTFNARVFYFLSSVIGFFNDEKTMELESWPNVIPHYDKYGIYILLNPCRLSNFSQ